MPDELDAVEGQGAVGGEPAKEPRARQLAQDAPPLTGSAAGQSPDEQSKRPGPDEI